MEKSVEPEGLFRPVPGVTGRKYQATLAFLAATWFAALSGASQLSAEVTAHVGSIELPTYPWEPPVPHPYFRETDGKNIYPYPMLDNLQREKERRTWSTVVLENDYLRITFLPELGGKIHEVTDKTASRPVFYVNHVVKPGLIGQCGAWVAGGIEFNTGPAGHTVSAVQPVDVQILPPRPDGSRSVAVGEVERIYGTRWTVVVTLRPGRSFIEETIRIYNRTETVRPYYFWNCTAVPSTPGFRFIYPMTLGTDHSGKTFYTWPLSEGKDLSYARNYRDAASIFAYRCDQDFFGSYDESADRGVVACADHHVLPGKKAWTWGTGSYGTMHQMDLTDDDGPYNEVQTGPLPTQADVGRLDPHEAVTWREWWYPVRGIGGFTYANCDVAVNATPERDRLRLRIFATGTWKDAGISVTAGALRRKRSGVDLSPRSAVDVSIEVGEAEPPFEVEISTGEFRLARFEVPLELPSRTPPATESPDETAYEMAQAGWQEYLFARLDRAEELFRQAIEKSSSLPLAHTGLALLALPRNPAAAAASSRRALSSHPDLGLPRYILARAELASGDDSAALDQAWKATLDPTTAIAARSLVAKILLRRGEHEGVVRALILPGPWQSDPVSRGRLALAFWHLGNPHRAGALARECLRIDPLDAFARSILWLAGRERPGRTLAQLIGGQPEAVLELASTYEDLGEGEIALRILERFYIQEDSNALEDPRPWYRAAYLAQRLGQCSKTAAYLDRARSISVVGVFPHREASLPALEWAADVLGDGPAALLLGHLLFSLGRHERGRERWEQAATAGAQPAIAWRALGMAALRIDDAPRTAERLLQRAHETDPTDAIVARDRARVLFRLAGSEEKGAEDGSRRRMFAAARETLQRAFEAGQSRSDYVALLARANNRLGRYAETADLLDKVRITIWEGAHEVHDLFVQAHLELGREHLEAGRAAEALAECERALEYPENLATGKPENACQSIIHYERGRALAALGRVAEARAAWKQALDDPPSRDAEEQKARELAREALDSTGGH